MGRFCLFSFIFQLPFYTLVFSEWGCFFLLVRLGRGDTKDFLSLSKKVLVTLIRFICSFFSTARRTNQEAPPLLSGFWVRRYGRRRGLRNSLRSDSPSPFSSVFLATSPPDKGGDFACAFASLFNLSVFLTPSPFGHSPYIPLRKHRGRGLKVVFQFRYKDTLCTFPLCCVSGMGEGVEIYKDNPL